MPLPDFPKQVLAILGVVFAFVFTVFKFWRFSAFSAMWPFFLAYFVLAGFSCLANFGSVKYSLMSHFLVFLSVVCFLFCLCTWINKFGRKKVQDAILVSLVISGFGVGIIGIMRHYGALTYVLPWMTVLGDRFVGPWGQPNLTALILVIGLVGWVYHYERCKGKSAGGMLAGASFLVYCGALTGSRAWVVMMALVTLFPVVRAFWHSQGISKGGLSFILENTKYHWMILAIFLVVWPASGPIDEMISKPLIDADFLDRKPASEVLKRQTDFSGGARFREWEAALSNLDRMDSFWFGHGLGRYGNYSQSLKLIEKAKSSNGKLWTHPHNLLIMLLVEMGVLGGGVAFLALLVLGVWLLRLPIDERTNALVLVVVLLIFQNMIEFSFWYLPFLFVFVAVLASLAPTKPFEWSGALAPKMIGASVLVVTLTTGVFVIKDYGTLTKVYLEKGRGDVSQYQIEKIKTSPFLGYAAYKTSIIYFNPKKVGLESRLERVNELVEWRPDQAFMLRKASLMAALGKQGTCKHARNTAWLYPDTFHPLMRELEFLNEQEYQSCAVKGHARWL